MSKFIISTGYGADWRGTFQDRFDSELIKTLEKLNRISPERIGNTEKRSTLEKQLYDRMTTLGFECAIDDMHIAKIKKGTRFKICEYDGAEYIITEEQLIHVAP